MVEEPVSDLIRSVFTDVCSADGGSFCGFTKLESELHTEWSPNTSEHNRVRLLCVNIHRYFHRAETRRQSADYLIEIIKQKKKNLIVAPKNVEHLDLISS